MVDQEVIAPCRVCGGLTSGIGSRQSSFSSGRAFEFSRCDECGYSQVVNPRTDFAALYDADYYAGHGADPLTDYEAELVTTRSIREYEWAGLLEIVRHLGRYDRDTRWLDFGCGLGGAVRYGVARGMKNAYGFDEGYADEVLKRDAVPRLGRSDFADHAGTFDVITSIDVIEHTTDPLEFLREIRDLLKPGGTLFLTTGNAEPFRGKLVKWSYTSVPEVHIGFFEPRTLFRAYEQVGLTGFTANWPPGFDALVRYKVLKNLRVKRQNWAERLVPWPVVSRMVDRKFKLSGVPLARRPLEFQPDVSHEAQ